MTLHWLVALLIIANFSLGSYMPDLPLSPQKLAFFSYHKWIGITILLLFFLRFGVRLVIKPPPPLPAPAWQHKVAAVTHGLLYVLMFAIPLTGWMMSTAKGFPVVYFGVLPLPDLVAKNQVLGESFRQVLIQLSVLPLPDSVSREKELGELLKMVHWSLNLGLFLLVGMHVAAAFKHHFIDRDDTLRRMLPTRKNAASSNTTSGTQS